MTEPDPTNYLELRAWVQVACAADPAGCLRDATLILQEGLRHWPIPPTPETLEDMNRILDPHFAHSSATPAELQELSERIWSRPPYGFDQRAMANIYVGHAALRTGDFRLVRRCCAAAVVLVAEDCGWDRDLDRFRAVLRSLPLGCLRADRLGSAEV